jgi:hypothetical protein
MVSCRGNLVTVSLIDDYAAAEPDAVIRRGGESFVAASAAPGLIDRAERRGVAILGLEGFLINDNAVYFQLMIASGRRLNTHISSGSSVWCQSRVTRA